MQSRSVATSLLIALTALALGVAACGRASSPSTSGDPDPGQQQGDDDDDGGTGDDDDDGGEPTPEETEPVETPTPDPTVTPEPEQTPDPTPEPEETPSPCVPTATDMDCDGFPDEVDNIPCQAFELTISNKEVSSASILLNGTEIAGTNDFPSEDPIVLAINPVTGTNTLTIGGKLSGSPGDELRFVVIDGDGNLLFDQTVSRASGAPAGVSVTFEVDVTCD